MAFDCICIDFKNPNSKKHIETIKQIFPYVEITPFVKSYNQMVKHFVGASKTEYTWILSSLIDYSNFDFDYIPEQHQKYQLHTWAVKGQKEGDTFLAHKNLLLQDTKFLRDFKHVNYHTSECYYDYPYDLKNYNLSNNFDLNHEVKPSGKYFQYSEKLEKENFYISYWEDEKIYIKGKTFFIPYVALRHLKDQVYDYNNILEVEKNKEIDQFDIAYISNGEPFENDVYEKLQQHLTKNKLGNRLYWIKNVSGRSQAYKKAAEESQTEYFYAVFAKSVPVDSFKFNFTVDRGKNKRHYIFHARLKELDLEYGTFNINLYNRTLCISTPNDVLDFTLNSKHEVVPMITNEPLLCPDAYTGWKNAFREVSKLIYWNSKTPTVETSHRINKWKSTRNQWLAKGAKDAEQFLKQINFNYDQLQQTYSWDFCRKKFKSLYPEETFY